MNGFEKLRIVFENKHKEIGQREWPTSMSWASKDSG